MIRPAAYFWKQAPFLRLLPGLIAGILTQWNFHISPLIWFLVIPIPLVTIISFSFIPYFRRYSMAAIPGICAAVIFFAAGGLLVWDQDIRKRNDWIGHRIEREDRVIVSITTPLVEKEKTWRADAEADYLLRGDSIFPVRGRIIMYFSKDSFAEKPGYGTKLLIDKPLQLIKGPSNPGAFDFKRYCLFQGITHQVFLTASSFEILPGRNNHDLSYFIFSAKEKILDILRTNISGKKEAGLAEALLLGYKNDLDKVLVQTYSNTGVVHIIAVSGLHLGLVYMLLSTLLKPLRSNRKTRWLTTLLIIAGLWMFSLLAGAQASVLRSALMFSCISIGENLGRKTSVFNSMAASAFILICLNPFVLWDVGFQLSYAAVASIVIFMKPVYNWFYLKNPLLDMAWKLNAVTISAQVLTVPLTLFYFHQFPTWFLITNFIAVPLSSAILLGEIFLCSISFWPPLAQLTGKLLAWMIGVMNRFVERIEILPYALLQGIQVSIAGAMLLFFFIAGLSWWLIERSKRGFFVALLSILLYIAEDAWNYHRTGMSRILIVYDFPRHTAIDFITGHQYWFVGDGNIVRDTMGRKFHLDPTRLKFRSRPGLKPRQIYLKDQMFCFGKMRGLLYGENRDYSEEENKQNLDLVIISGNHEGSLEKICAAFAIKQVVIDSSVPVWKVREWEDDCAIQDIPCHAVANDGAFVMNF